MSYYSDIEEIGKAFQGKNELLSHLNKEKITIRNAVKAKCYDCMGWYSDGRQDCKITKCPLYPWMPYKEGGARKREMSAEQKKEAAVRLKHALKRSAVPEKRPMSKTKKKRVVR